MVISEFHRNIAPVGNPNLPMDKYIDHYRSFISFCTIKKVPKTMALQALTTPTWITKLKGCYKIKIQRTELPVCFDRIFKLGIFQYVSGTKRYICRKHSNNTNAINNFKVISAGFNHPKSQEAPCTNPIPSIRYNLAQLGCDL